MSTPDYLFFLSKAVQAAGSERKLAASLGLSPPAVNHWMKRGVVPSPEAVLKIEELFGIPKEYIRPDIFKGNPSEAPYATLNRTKSKKEDRMRP